MHQQWKLFEKPLAPLFWIALLFAFASLGAAFWVWPVLALRLAFIAAAIGCISLAIAVKAYSTAISYCSPN